MRAIVARSNSSIFNVKASLVPKRLRGVQRNAYTKSRKNHRIRKGNRQFIELLAGSETPGAYGSLARHRYIATVHLGKESGELLIVRHGIVRQAVVGD